MLKLSNENYQFGKGIMEGNILFVPGSNRSSNQAFYLRIDTQTDLNEVSVVRSDLEVDPQYPLTQALFIQRIDGNIYVGGVQFGKACYWKDGKILSLESDPKIIRSYPIQFLPYRN